MERPVGKTLAITMGIILSVVIIGVLFLSLVAFGMINFSSNPPRPAIKHGEFPFRLVYELDGQTIEVKDTLICDFDGLGWNEASINKFRKWKSHLKSGNKWITLYKSGETEIFYSPNMSQNQIAAVYMGDTEIYHNDIYEPFPSAYYKLNEDIYHRIAYRITAEDMWKKYKLKLISWEPSQPIKNSFR